MDTHIEEKCGAENEPIAWLAANVELRQSNPREFLYDHMESQSGRCLPVIYVPFDGQQRGHFADRGQILDFATAADGGRVLDFGPGDGWPSLLIAPMVEEVVGVEASRRRVEVCTRNARRLGLDNVRFVHVPPGASLPFEANSFDAVVAASSVEQTPNPKATLMEFHRVLNPGARLRTHYESLSYYRDGREREIVLMGPDSSDSNEFQTRLLIYDRNVQKECVRHYGLVLHLSATGVKEIFAQENVEPSYTGLTPKVLGALRNHLLDAATWTTQHPSCATFCEWLTEIGFRQVKPTYNGGWFAARLFDRLAESERPEEIDAVDKLLRPVVEVVATMEARCAAQPGQWEPWITAIK